MSINDPDSGDLVCIHGVPDSRYCSHCHWEMQHPHAPTYETRLRDEAAMRVLAAIYAHKGADQYPGEAVFLAEQVAAAWIKSRRTRQEC